MKALKVITAYLYTRTNEIVRNCGNYHFYMYRYRDIRGSHRHCFQYKIIIIIAQ